MKKALLTLTLSGLLAAPVMADTTPTTEEDRLSYSLGLIMGQRLKQEFTDLNVDMMSQAVKDLYADGEMKMTEAEVKETMQAYQQKKMLEQQEAQAKAAEANLKAGQDFMVQNGKKKGVVTTDSGLQYQVLTAGNGAKPALTDQVKVHYEGKLLNGKVFDSSYQRGEPVTFGLNQVIQGWQEGLQLMSVGSKWKIFIPSDLAYGPGGTGGPIGPNETLIFEVELLDINPEA
ncbi:FKBP-type peptidyl-prolyl cis-trans isomerase [Oceanospirillum linum]|uniref:Peptidyl-prolyl cis-trans isomerase n=1 Tax=Oceanospirillum linum TaxID=966 RepID=A0A1T1HBI7_OCELI|nr:FKBP-type peptidyl-prolyl cis-trans isomerase [Oceanospirillum linum]OOV87156.1 peptidylprolyl isomerase [Oceanospirillum linum]SEF76381.1 FKBP-type peptidyl-prolyl cis-trans isomerase FklB [Oleiphilus messinensis]SMP17459.1 FKBP-type peptidyl-prolyl cis-trans isomerase FklB [Oceanospirillum linum]